MPSHWPLAFQQFSDILMSTPQAAHLMATIFDLLDVCIRENTQRRYSGSTKSRMDDRYGHLLTYLAANDTAHIILDIISELVGLGDEGLAEAALNILARCISWIGVTPVVHHTVSRRLMSIVQPNSNPPAITFAAWNTVHEIFKYPLDLHTKLRTLQSLPVLHILQSADTTTKVIGTLVASVASTIGKDIILCWRVFGYAEHPNYNICATLLQASINLNFKLLTPYSHRQARHVIMSYVKCFVEEVCSP